MKKLKIIFFTLIVSLLFLSQGFAQTYYFQNKLKLVKQGAVTAANAQYSLVNPAFFYAVGVDLTAYQTGKHLIAFYDATGLLIAMGYCSITPPAGESLDGTLGTNVDFESAEPPGVVWTRQSTWVITGGQAVASTTNGYVQQSVNMTAKALYKMTVDCATRTAGEYSLTFDASPGPSYTATGTQTRYRTVANASANMGIGSLGSNLSGTFNSLLFQKVLDPPSTGLRIVNNDKVTQTWVKTGTGAANGAITYKIWLCN